VTKKLSKRFQTLSEAEEAFNIDYIRSDTLKVETSGRNLRSPSTNNSVGLSHSSPMSPIFTCSTVPDTSEVFCGDAVKNFLTCLTTMSSRLKEQLLNYIFKQILIGSYGMDFCTFVTDNFLNSSLSAMKLLFDGKKANLILKLSNCFEGPSPRMPIDRMPFGLLDYNIKFFSSLSSANIKMEGHYSSWLDTMFAHFGHKWLCLHRGPTWQYETCAEQVKDIEQKEESSTTDDNIIEKALMLSSIDLEDSIDNVDDINISMCNMSLSTSDEISSFYIMPHNEEDIPLVSTQTIECADTDDPPVVISPAVSHLWTSLSSNDSREIELGLVSPEQMEQFHNIVPMANPTRRRNPAIFNPLKVCANMVLTDP
jgi:hypothetical protein